MNIVSLQNLINLLAKLPSLGPRSARRLTLYLINNQDMMLNISKSLENVAQDIKICSECMNIDVESPCNICLDQSRDSTTLCVVEGITELWAMERSNLYKGKYHVLGGTLSAIEGKTPENLNIASLKEKVAKGGIKEVIIATNATLEGEITGHYILDALLAHKIKVTRLAYGIPMGAELDHIDEGTLNIAFKLRQDF